jgi:hypothetical protein
MEDLWIRFTTDMAARVSGPMKFRLVLQPLMASFLAIRAGVADARAGRPPYFWHLARNSADRKAIIKDGWKSVSRVFILAVLLDVVYQLYVLHFWYPFQTVVVAFVLAIVPYLMLRGLVTRLARTESRTPSTRRHMPPGASVPDVTANRHS